MVHIMTTRKRRLQVTIEPALEPILLKLSNYLDKPQATIITDLLMESLPALSAVADALEQAKQGKLDVSGFQKALANGRSEIDEIDEELSSLKQKYQ